MVAGAPPATDSVAQLDITIGDRELAGAVLTALLVLQLPTTFHIAAAALGSIVTASVAAATCPMDLAPQSRSTLGYGVSLVLL